MTNKKIIVWLIMGPLVVALGLASWSYMHNKALENNTSRQNEDLGPQPFLPPEITAEIDPETQARNDLQLAIKKFRSAKSFRVSLQQNTDNGDVSGEIEYVKPLRMHALLNLPGTQVFDAIIIGETVYIRTGVDSWEMSDDPFAKDFGIKFFSSMSTADDSLASFGIADNPSIEIQDNSSKKCALYKTQYSLNEAQYDIDFCINENNEIFSIRTETKDGEMYAEYKDYNSLFLIERPRLPLLELRSPVTDQP